MYYDRGSYVKYEIKMSEAQKVALAKCKNWGYSDAEFFGGTSKRCIYYDKDGYCSAWRVFYKCQCIGGK